MIAMIVEIPNDVKVEVRGNEVIVEGSLGSNIRKFNDALLSVSIKGNELWMREGFFGIYKSHGQRVTGSKGVCHGSRRNTNQYYRATNG